MSRCTSPPEWLEIWAVDNKVGNVRNTGAELVLPLEDADLEPRESRALRLVAPGRGTLGGDRLDQGCFDRRKALFKHRDGVPKIVSARCQRSGEQRIFDI